MLWYKAWLETRWRFLIGLAVLMCSAAGVVFQYPAMLKLLAQVQGMPTVSWEGELGRRVQEGIELAREYRGFVWSQGFRQNLAQMGTLFAVLLGTGGLLRQSSGGGVLWTLSLPVSRRRLLAVRAAIGLAQWSALVVATALLIPLLSPAIGQHYGVVDALAHGVCLFVAGAVFFSLALLFSTVFGDIWRPLLLALLVAVALGALELAARGFSGFGVFAVMSGEQFFRTGRLPVPGLFVSAALSAAFLYGATLNFARREF